MTTMSPTERPCAAAVRTVTVLPDSVRPGAFSVIVPPPERGSPVFGLVYVKERELGVPRETLERFGAVSEETAAAMSAGVRGRLGADVAVSVTGIAGPGGGSAEKPIGLVYVHAATPEASHGIHFTYGQDRESIRRRATVASLHLLRRVLTRNRDGRA